jgi:hypothetical protein
VIDIHDTSCQLTKGCGHVALLVSTLFISSLWYYISGAV